MGLGRAYVRAKYSIYADDCWIRSESEVVEEAVFGRSRSAMNQKLARVGDDRRRSEWLRSVRTGGEYLPGRLGRSDCLEI